MISLSFFNNKGGVGKTTLACNVAAFMAERSEPRLRVLIVDADPQCNATQLILGEEKVTKLYAAEATQSTLAGVLMPISHGEAVIDKNITPLSAADNRFGVDLLPGHPHMSLVEDRLATEWGKVMGGDVGGIRKTNWCRQLLEGVKESYDLVIFDLGPSLGALNRTVLIGVDAFVTPMGCDIFSIMGIKNISEWLTAWTGEYKLGLRHCENRERGVLAHYGMTADPDDKYRFVGYTVQQYITKSIRGERRATRAYEEIKSEIPAAVDAHLSRFLRPGTDPAKLKLGDIPHLFSLVPLAQSANAPIHDLTSKDSLVGSQFQQQQVYIGMVQPVVDQLRSNIGLGGSDV
ncbi:MAG TPA: AAA family ATPase [Thermoanaerobaculia bacterium]